MIELKHINKSYDGHITALSDVNLTIQDGEIFGIIGQSGAGKSTLIRCINMLEPPTSGEVIINGKDMTKLSNKELREERKHIGMIFQHFNLLSSRTVYKNVAFPLELANVPKEEQEKKIMDILDLVGLTEYKDKYPAQLSGGQKQRVGIARAIVTNPPVLLSDEATSALDPETVKSILQLLKDINRKLHITIIMITHQMEVIKQIADRVAVIEKGKIIEESSVVDLFTNPKTETSKKFIGSVISNEIPDAAVESLRRKVTCCDKTDEFITIDKFIRSSWYENSNYDLVVVDECSTVKNEDILKVMNRAEGFAKNLLFFSVLVQLG